MAGGSANAQRVATYPPLDLAAKQAYEIDADLWRIAQKYEPRCFVFADVKAHTIDERVQSLPERCQKRSKQFAESSRWTTSG